MQILHLPITQRKEIAKGVFEVHFTLSSPFIFRPGQYVRVIVPNLLRPDPKGNYRDFSIANSPDNTKELIIAFRSSGSGFKTSLLELPEGSAVKITGPFGNLDFDDQTDSANVFIAGGIGITAFLGKINSLHKNGSERETVLLYSNSSASNIPYFDELEEVKKNINTFSFLSKVGAIDGEFISNNIKTLNNPKFFIAGPSGMIRSTENLLLNILKIPEDRIHSDEYVGYEKNSEQIGNSVGNNKPFDVESDISDHKTHAVLAALDKTARVSMTTIDGTIIYVNNKFLEVTKYSRDEVIGQNHRMFKSGYHTPEFYRNLWDTITNGKVWRGELKDRAKDGSFFWVDTSIAPILNSNDTPEFYIAVGFPITDKKQLEESLVKENQTFFKEITNTINEVFFITSGDLRQMLYISPGYEKIWGRSVQSLYDNPASWVDSVHPEDRASVIKDNFETDHVEPFSQSYRIINLDNEIRWIHVKAFPIVEGGKRIRLVGIADDITKQREITVKLRESEERFKQIADNIEQLFFLIDPTKPETLYASKAYENIFGDKVKSLYDNPSAWIAHVIPVDRPRMLESFKNVLVNTIKGPIVEDFTIMHPTKGPRNISVRLTSVKNEFGNVYRVAGVLDDVTELKDMQERALKLEGELRLESAQKEFISIASHQLKTPVAGLSWTMDSLNISPEVLNDKQRSYFKNMRGFIEMLNRTVEELLNVSRIDLGTLKVNREAVDLHNFVTKFIQDMKPYIEMQKHGVVLNEDSEKSIVIESDPKLLYNILQNLVSNGVEYSATDTDVVIDIESDPTSVIISITNTGEIPTTAKEHLFQKFYRSQEAVRAKPNGTGVGLFIAKSFVDQLGGSIGFKSDTNNLTTFWIKLPLIKL